MRKEKLFDPFVHLHVHTDYSFLDGFGHPHEFANRAKALGQRAIACTDHGNVSCHKKFHDACKEAGVKPLLGVEAYVADDASKKEKQRWHLTLLAKNLVGYRNVLKLVTKAWQDGFYYKPRTDWAMLKGCSEGLVATSGCPSGKIGRGIIKNGWDAKAVATELKRQAGLFKDYYVELSPWKFKEGVGMAQLVYKVAKAEGLPMVLTMDAHYPEPKDAHIQDVMLCIQNKTKFNDPDRMKFSQQDFCINSGDEMAAKWRAIHGKKFPLLDEMILNTGRIADECSLEFPTATPLEFPHDGDKVEFMRQWCEKGMKLRRLKGKVYRDRLEYEFGLVCSKNFVDYFLIVADLIVWAKQQGILVGAARGSSCGSLMCYLMQITDIDPIPHGLIFERFIDVSRADLPDIDIDFESERRDEVKTYLERKYGSDRVANLATFGTFKGKLCLQDIGRVFSDTIPQEAVEETKRLIVQRSSADARAGFTIEDTFVNFEQAAGHLKKYPELGLAKEMEGHIRQLGIHAAGVVISNEPIGNFAAIYKTPQKGERVISMDYDDASSVGLLKIDILGITALTAIKHMLRLIKKAHGLDIDLLRIRYDDEEVYDNFCRNHLHGIFQFEGESTRQVCRQIQPRNFRDIVAINALSRPGPLHCIEENVLVRTASGKTKIKWIVEGQRVYSWNGKKYIPNRVKRKYDNGVQTVFELTTENGYQIQATDEHHFLTKDGWKRLKELKAGDKVLLSFKNESSFKKGIRTSAATMFKKGLTPWNKGKKNEALSKFCKQNGRDYMNSPEAKRNWKKVMDWEKNRERLLARNPTMWSQNLKKRQSVLMKKYYKDNPGKHPNVSMGRNWMCSKPQMAMFETIFSFFPSARLNERIEVKDTAYFADVLVPELNLIFEYDDTEYWHKDNTKDKIRDRKLEAVGYKVLRFEKKTLTNLPETLSKLVTVNNTVGFKEIKSIARIGKRQTFDLEMENAEFPNYLANGFVVHNSGGTTNFIERRFGRQEIESIHPIYDRVTKDTYGITVYQEQVMNLVREMGQFSWKETATIRKAMSKKLGDEFFQAMGKKFVEGAASQGVKEETAKLVFANICTFGSWAFNLSHSVAYSTTAYQLMWLKTHYPVEFYTGTANVENDDEKKRRLLKEYTMGGGKILPVCVNRSEMGVSAEKDGLRLGLDAVVGLNSKRLEKMIEARPFKHLADFELRHGLPPAQKEKLLKIGAARDLDYVVDQGDLFGNPNALAYKEPKREDVAAFCPLAVESDLFGKWRAWLQKKVKDELYSVRDLDEISERQDVLIFGTTNPKTSFNLKNKMEEEASRGNEWKAKEGEEDLTREQYNFLNFNIEDETDNTIVRISYKLYPKFKAMMWALPPGSFIAVRGMVTGTMRMVFAYSIINLYDLRQAYIDKKPLDKLQKAFVENSREKKNWRRRSEGQFAP
jgi:DNA polymerase III alpha subunit